MRGHGREERADARVRGHGREETVWVEMIQELVMMRQAMEAGGHARDRVRARDRGPEGLR